MTKEKVISSIPIYHIIKFDFKMVLTCNINHPLLECLIINDDPWPSINNTNIIIVIHKFNM